MTDYRGQLARALRALTVTSPTSYAWFGRQSRPLPRALVAAVPPEALREHLVEALQRELYRSFYTQGRPVPLGRDGARYVARDPGFADALSRANAGAGGWEPGWRIESVERGTAVLVRNGLQVRARLADCRVPRAVPLVRAPVSVRRPKEIRARSPGFYTALSDAVPAEDQDDLELRVYFNVTAAGAALLVAVCTRLLNEAGVPFSLKVVDHPAGFSRCDAAVLYLDSGDFDRVREPLPAIASACALHLRGDAPAFAKTLWPGVAVGEHRASVGASFGSSRCRLVAEGVVAAYDAGARRLADRIDAVARRFAQSGLAVDVPYLAPESSDRYEV